MAKMEYYNHIMNISNNFWLPTDFEMNYKQNLNKKPINL